jgi:hypothetical protein
MIQPYHSLLKINTLLDVIAECRDRIQRIGIELQQTGQVDRARGEHQAGFGPIAAWSRLENGSSAILDK